MNKTLVTILIIILVLAGVAGWYLFFYKPVIGQPVLPENPYSDLIQVDSPKPNQTIQNHFIVKGQARGYWYFEASFPIKLVDLSGNVIGQAIAQAQGDWMTENFVPFESTLNFDIATTTMPAILILHNDNPSGLPENDKEVRIPVILIKPLASSGPRTVQLYYYNPKLDNIACSEKGLVAVERQIPITQTPIQDAIKLLLKGELTSQEISQGITSEYPLEGFSLEAASLNNKVLTLTFKDSGGKTVGGSCRVGILWNQIKATAKQFPEVSEVKFMPEELFQP